MNRWTRVLPVVAIAAAAGLYLTQTQPVDAADHTDPPDRVGTPGNAADIGDIYAWHNTAEGTLTVALTFSGPLAPAADQAGNYDDDVLYAIHIDNTGDNVANHNIYARFGQNDLGDWGVRVEGIPGATAPVEGAVEATIDAGNDVKVWAGLRDDPFFFDLEGFQDTLSTGDLSFDNTRDSFAGANITTIVLEMPLDAARGAETEFQVWATTGTL
ncbi:DUF4331 domain-containing protein [Microvenator marinus]|uniref:DUF4331 domain-containing protein n=1 Tax=Microvenator marinus TaxID=2600177 RepID=A0A5B8XZ42_9DELT|nr:DUF4331 family protein [Microvenator marinus]QED28719.1 DUF4331 domain-containing protein [Microvenator marinus]